jgi:hypothetical protein
MLILRMTSVDAAPSAPVTVAVQLVIGVVICCFCRIGGLAQISVGEATVTRADQGATISTAVTGTSSPLQRNVKLQQGDVLMTGPKSRIVIAMSDGSQVVIYERSRVEIMDFTRTGYWHELLNVTAGRIRATINHSKRPSPYRVYSPVASIGVRGTDFMVIVEPNHETRVLVFEGLVEVSSLVNPQKSVLVQPGRNIIIRPDGDISLVTAAPRGELNEIRSLRVGNTVDSNLNGAFSTHPDNFYDLRPSRFAAFNDSHLDSLQNPAYSGEFRDSSGRFFLLPSFSPKINTRYTYNSGTQEDRPSGILSTNYTLSTQLSFFTPISARMVVGGGVAVTRTDIGGAETEGPYSADRLRRILASDLKTGFHIGPEPPGGQSLPEDGAYTLRHNGNAKFTTSTIALMLARRFGQTERTTLGLKFDYQDDRSSYNLDSTWSTNLDFKHEKAVMPIRRIGFTLGLTHNFSADKKLGLYYRYNNGAIRSQFHRTQFYTVNEFRSFYTGLGKEDYFNRRSRRLFEVGGRFRGSLTRRLFYGVEGSFLDDYERFKYRHVFIPATGEEGFETQHTRTRSGLLGAGLGYALRRRAVLGVDFSAGGAFGDFRTEHQNPPNIDTSDGFGDRRSNFWSLHFGGQTDLWKNFFVSGSRLLLRDRERYQNSSVIGGRVFFFNEGSLYERSKLSHLSLGWRMTPSWIVQYTYFTSHDLGAPSHTFMFRYEFGRKATEQ